MKQAAILALAFSALGAATNVRGMVGATGATGAAGAAGATGATGATGVAAVEPAAGATGAAVAAAAAATGAASIPAPKGEEGKWLQDIRKSVTSLTVSAAVEDAARVQVCKAEKASIKAEQQEEEKEEKDDRAAQKAGLADALDARVGGIAKHLNKLMALQEQLKQHIDRTNSVYQKKYVQDAREMKVASQAFESLMEHATEGNPSDHPIKLPKIPNLPGAVAASPPKGNGTSSLLEVTAKSRIALHEDMMRARLANAAIAEPTCASASEGALSLFHKGARYHEEIKQFFEAERKVLAAFREQLASVIKSKLAKMAKLKAQSAALRKAMATPEVDMKRALGEALKAHEDLVTSACSQMDAHTASNGPLRASLVRESVKCGGGNGLGEAVKGLSQKVDAVEADVRRTKAEVNGATGAAVEATAKVAAKVPATGGATGGATGAAEKAQQDIPQPIPGGGTVITVF
jgi:hypothetical protein